jgi:hypothetical protein
MARPTVGDSRQAKGGEKHERALLRRACHDGGHGDREVVMARMAPQALTCARFALRLGPGGRGNDGRAVG